MNKDVRRSRPSWRVSETRAVRPGVLLLALGVVGLLLVEVWGSARVAELSLRLDRSHKALDVARARLEFVHADLDRRTTRAELAPLAAQLGLAPVDAQQVVVLPAEYLAGGATSSRSSESASVLAWAERASRVLVPEATARGSAGN